MLDCLPILMNVNKLASNANETGLNVHARVQTLLNIYCGSTSAISLSAFIPFVSLRDNE